MNNEIKEMCAEEICAVNGGGLFNWISRITAGTKIYFLGIQLSDGIPNNED